MKKYLTLILTCISYCCVAQKVTIALDLKKDSTYYLATDANLTVDQTVAGNQQVITTLVSSKISHKVTAIHDTVYQMDVAYMAISMHMTLGGQQIDFDAKDVSNANPMAGIMRSMLNKPFTMTISRTGRVLEIKNMDNLYNSMFDSFPQVTDAQKAQLKTQMQQSFGEKSIRGNFQDAFAMYPTNALAVNDKWTTTTVTESGLTAKIKTVYTLQSITKDAFMIHGDASVIQDDKPELKQFNSIPMRFVGASGTVTSNLKIDRKTGWISEARVAKLLKATVEIPDSPTIPGGMSFQMSISGDLVTSNK